MGHFGRHGVNTLGQLGVTPATPESNTLGHRTQLGVTPATPGINTLGHLAHPGVTPATRGQIPWVTLGSLGPPGVNHFGSPSPPWGHSGHLGSIILSHLGATPATPVSNTLGHLAHPWVISVTRGQSPWVTLGWDQIPWVT
ncbi:unnamed protein product [Linum trigynum]|uniref:Uncharacterized protein n=1 Tax=Linum trigynum TaxID=586398 RepID=A0AAV2CXF5_9ROSI